MEKCKICGALPTDKKDGKLIIIKENSCTRCENANFAESLNAGEICDLLDINIKDKTNTVFEIGKCYRHTTGSDMKIVGELNTTMWG